MSGFIGPDDPIIKSDFVGPDAPMAAAPNSGAPNPPDLSQAHVNPEAFERSSNYPNSKMTDPTISDLLALQGATGLAKNAVQGAVRGVGATLNALPLTENVVPTIGEMADNQLIKSLGGRVPRSASMSEIQDIRDAASAGRKAGLEDIFSTRIGRREGLENLKNTIGKDIGSLRQEAGPASPDFLKSVASDPSLAPYNGQGLQSGQLGTVEKALATARETAGEAPTHAGLANAATDINSFAAKNKLFQPTGPASDVANAISAKNNAEIAQKLGSDKAAQYVDSLKNESDLFKLQNLLGKGEVRELNQNKGVAKTLLDAVESSASHRATAKGLNTLYQGLNGPLPVADAAKHAAELTPASVAEYISRQDKDQGMSDGGVVTSSAPVNDISDEIKAWVNGYRKSDNGTLVGLRNVMRDKDKPSDPLEYDKDSPADRKKSSDSE